MISINLKIESIGPVSEDTAFMNAFELNKIIGWVLAAALVIVGGQTFMEIYSAGHGDGKAEKTAYVIEVEGDDAGKTEKKAEAPKPLDIKPLLATASVEIGAKVAKKCKACHSFDKGGKNKVGPALYEVLNRKLASNPGFSYSNALKSKGGAWDYDALAAFLKSPKKFAPGTKMAFSGIRKDEKLASLIFYLRSLSDNPAKLP